MPLRSLPRYPPDAAAPVAWDEAVDADGGVRRSHASALRALDRIGLPEASARIGGEIDRLGISFGEDDERFAVDPVPRVIEAAEWRRLERGLAQRARALDAFVADVHGERRAIEAGVVPATVVDRSPAAEPDLDGPTRAAGVRIAITGPDLVRDASGRFRVIEDNCRTPSGLAYLLATRTAVDAAIGVPDDVRPVHEAVGPALLTALRATTPAGVEPGAAVLLSDGPANTAWWEHRQLAAAMGIPLVLPEQLRARGDQLLLRDGGAPITAVYRRTDETSLHGADGRLSAVGELLLGPLRGGTLGLMNGPGAAIAGDKAVYPYVDRLIRFFCDEPPILSGLAGYDLDDPQQCEAALDRADQLVFKPRDGQGGEGVTIGPQADRAALRAVTEAVRADPAAWIAQEAVVLSTHPTAIDGRLRPRHVDLRPFVLADGRGDWQTLPGALTRFARDEGEMVVNSSRGGGAKDTWVLA